jgi:insertion element IS1 protein InsB
MKKALKVSNPKCCKCKSKSTVRAGFVKGKQRYKCKECHRRFVIAVKIKIKQKQKQLAIALYLEGLGLRSAGRISGVSHVTVVNWIRKESKSQKRILPQSAPIIEIDELYYFLKNKKRKRFVWLAVCRKTQRILAWQLGSRSRKTLSKLIHKIEPISCQHYYTDEHISFRGLFPKEKYTVSKLFTCTVEGINSVVRHFLARMRRRTKCYTKSESMLDATIGLFAERYNELKMAA